MLRRTCTILVSRSRGRWNHQLSHRTRSGPQKRDTFSRSAPTSSSTSTSTTTTTTASFPTLATTTNNSSASMKTILNAIRTSSSTQSMLPLIGHGAYIAIVSGFLMTDMLSLRLMLVGGYTGLVTFHSLHAKPLKIPLRWSAVFVLVNAGAAIFLLLDQFGATLSDEEETLFENHFSKTLTRGQFFQLMKLAHVQDVPNGTTLTKEGHVSPYLYFILDGRAKVYHNKMFAAYVDQGGFVNDVAFQQQQNTKHAKQRDGKDDNDQQIAKTGSYGTVITNGQCKMLVWDSEDLQRHLKNRPDMDRNLKYLLSQHLMKSLLKQREARHAKARERHINTERWYNGSSRTPTKVAALTMQQTENM